MKKILQFIENNKTVIFLLVMFCLFFFLRFNNIEKRIIFDWDQEQFSIQIRELFRDHNITLLGPRVTDAAGFFLAPYFVYILAPFYLFTNLHPWGMIPFLITVNAGFFFLAFFVIKKIFSSFHALIFLFFWAINPLLISYDINTWNPLLIPLGIMSVWYLIFLLYKDPKLQYWILLGVALGVFVNMHFQFIFVIIFTYSFLLFAFWRSPWTLFKGIGLSIISFSAMFVPLLLFDIRHDFLNANLFTSYFTDRIADSVRDPNVWRTVFASFIEPLIIINSNIVAFIFLFFIALGAVFLGLKNKNFKRWFYVSTFVLMLMTVAGFIIYGRRPSEYYFTFLYPFIFIIIIDFMLRWKQKMILAGIPLLLFFLNFQKISALQEKNDFGLYYKDKTIQKIAELTKGKEFNISFDVPLGMHTGYDYLINYYDIQTTGNWEDDPLVEVRIPPHEGDILIHYIGISIPPDLQANEK